MASPLKSLFAAILLFAGSCGCLSAAEEWQVFKGTHFLAYHKDNAVEADKLCAAAEGHYDRIRSDLGFTKQDDFWLWEKRVKVFIYPSREDFVSATGAPKWAGGKSNAKKREIATFPASADFIETILPHELAHLVFRDFVGYAGEVPQWLDEGIAQWEEKPEERDARKAMMGLIDKSGSMSVADLARVDVRRISDSRKVTEFYVQSASLVGFLIEKQGSGRFRVFCGQLKDGKNLEDALRFTYPDTIRNVAALDSAWKEYLKKAAEATK